MLVFSPDGSVHRILRSANHKGGFKQAQQQETPRSWMADLSGRSVGLSCDGIVLRSLISSEQSASLRQSAASLRL
jgi:cytochrome c biogenesis factor